MNQFRPILFLLICWINLCASLDVAGAIVYVQRNPPSGISFYPNPVLDQVFIENTSTQTRTYQVALFDFRGNVLR